MAKGNSAPGDNNQMCDTHFVTPREPHMPSQDDFELDEKVSAWDAKHPGGSTFICRKRRAWFPEKRGFEILGRTKVLIKYIGA